MAPIGLQSLTLLHLLTGRHSCILKFNGNNLYNKAQYPYIGMALDFCGLDIPPTTAILMLGCAVLQAAA